MIRHYIYTKSPLCGGVPVAGPYSTLRQAITSLLHIEQETNRTHSLVTVEEDDE